MLSIYRKLIHGLLGLNHVFFFENIRIMDYFFCQWKLNAMIKNRGIDYLVLVMLFWRIFNNGLLGLKTLVFF